MLYGSMVVELRASSNWGLLRAECYRPGIIAAAGFRPRIPAAQPCPDAAVAAGAAGRPLPCGGSDGGPVPGAVPGAVVGAGADHAVDRRDAAPEPAGAEPG